MHHTVRLAWASLFGLYWSTRCVSAYIAQSDSKGLSISGSDVLSSANSEDRGGSLVRKEATAPSPALEAVSHAELLEQEDDKELMQQTASNPFGSALNSAKNLANDAASAAGLDKNQYVVWAPYVPPSPRAKESLEGKEDGVVGGLVSSTLDAAQNSWETANQAAKYCLVVNEGVPKSEGQIQIQQCDLASNLKSQFVLPEPGEVGPIKQKGKPENCIGVSKSWWGENKYKTDKKKSDFEPNALEITKCSSHVSEHNHTWLVPAMNETTGKATGLIVWATHTNMCMDLQDHVEEIKEVQEGDNGKLLQQEELRDGKKGDDKKDKDEVEIDGEENVRTFDGNLITLAPCIRIANWTIQATMPVTLAGGLSAAKGLLR